ncbi:phosphotransferase family protein [Actinacidiphila bryophytorum]|uniref:phosphotransferase family protein n=1 Tax=Actinacidiphila bryophytorum TaxID=1436133 RepID=UPI002176B55D|nr:aminoglycoside phosphotransferase family protein [Actinacidiphila bryophytorum]UWE09395.1 aminoglycoside phosphotransferase family protein [Actinacidiphila bryophytorum]
MTTTGEQTGTQAGGALRVDPQTVRRTARPLADDALVTALAAAAAAAARRSLRGDRPERAADPAAPTVPAATTVLADRPDGTVVRVGAVVAKAHAPGTDAAALAVRIAVAAHPLLRGILLAPLPAEAGHADTAAVPGRPVTAWPYGVPVDRHDPAAAPWAEAAVLLARLHTVPQGALPGPLPPMRGPAKAALAVARLRGVADSAAARTVRRAWRRLPAWARDEAPYPGPAPAALCHGDLHLGQLVRHPARDGDWLLIDVDDLGTGPAAWDLARPAMWFAAGLLAPEAWARFLAAYRAAGGPAVPETGDPWAQLDIPARTLAVQTAAIGVAKAARDDRDLDEAESELVATCARIAQLEPTSRR